MISKDDQTPTIQVLERSFALLDVLATHPDPVSLKVISERTGLHPSTAHRILNDLTIGRYRRPARRPAAIDWACACSNSATWSRRGWTCATPRSGRCASCTS